MSTAALQTAIWDRLHGDAECMALAGQGIWYGERPREEPWDETKPLTWVTYRVIAGSDTNDATGPRFRDVMVRILATSRSLASAEQLFALAGRIDTLMSGWKPTLSGWPNVWATEPHRTIEGRYTILDVTIQNFCGADYRFQYGK